MVADMRAHFVDTLLARLDGEVACIWVTIAASVEAAPEPEQLRAMVMAIHRATPRLQTRWSEPDGRWQRASRSDAELARTFELDEQPRSRRAILEQVIARRIDLGRDPGFWVGMHRLLDGGTLITFQLHHALGDARSLGLLLRRMFGDHEPARAHGSPMTESNLLRAALARPRASAGLLHPRTRMLASRGLSLPRDADTIGDPRVAMAAFELDGGPRAHAGWFYAGLAVTAARWVEARAGLIRLRVPVDLSEQLSFEHEVANTCITVPLELDAAHLRACTSGSAAVDYVRRELGKLIANGAVWPALLEALLVARVASRARLRAGARPGLLAERRTNTLVATYVGSLDEYFSRAPFRILSAIGHTPTWGANAFTIGGRLVVNVSGFAGLWSDATLQRFRDDLAAWLVEQGARQVEIGP